MADTDVSFPPGQVRPAPLSRRRKAAIIVRLALAEGIALRLDRLPPDLQAALTREMAALRTVDRATLDAAIADFTADLESLGLAFPSGLDGALALLGDALGAEAGDRLRLVLGAAAPDPWVRLSDLPSATLAAALTDESTEVAAIVLSKLKVSRAADLLGQLPGPIARRMTLAMARLGPVSPDTVARVGRALADRLDAAPSGAFRGAPEQRVGSVLNAATSATRNDLLGALTSEDSVLGDAVRRAIFTFAHIPARIDAREVPKITRAVEGAALTRALAAATLGAEAEARDFILANMSGRMAQQLRDEIDSALALPPAEGEAAMAEVTAAIRALEERGEIRLLPVAD
ncbi:FliG C-terminal domain-containing protein [Anianabacter salinae]|uniref:FliG C-terminal domain-containing protein n=1 Tax=Anianabacter salinae TaxID=2851023 RepID=UPI00225DF7C4|nr:FliG C-terminal domain-containing protein [Anianabacter salinae]MBV0912908.1 flagellar motor switch protein FliG [Anianabacter salinae]